MRRMDKTRLRKNEIDKQRERERGRKEKIEYNERLKGC